MSSDLSNAVLKRVGEGSQEYAALLSWAETQVSQLDIQRAMVVAAKPGETLKQREQRQRHEMAVKCIGHHVTHGRLIKIGNVIWRTSEKAAPAERKITWVPRATGIEHER